MERSDIRDSSRVARAPRVSLRSTRATNCKRREGPTWRQRHAPQAREPNESARAANFLLTRVTRIFQKNVLTEIAPVDEGGKPLSCSLSSASARCRVGLRNATTAGKKRPPDQLCFVPPVFFKDRCNFCACRPPPWPDPQPRHPRQHLSCCRCRGSSLRS